MFVCLRILYSFHSLMHWSTFSHHECKNFFCCSKISHIMGMVCRFCRVFVHYQASFHLLFKSILSHAAGLPVVYSIYLCIIMYLSVDCSQISSIIEMVYKFCRVFACVLSCISLFTVQKYSVSCRWFTFLLSIYLCIIKHHSDYNLKVSCITQVVYSKCI